MEKRKIVRAFGLVTALTLGGSALEACASGQNDPPTVQQLQNDGHFFQLTRPDGTPMECWSYEATGSNGSNTDASWLSVSCDWSGDYGTTTTTTEPYSGF